MKPCCLEQRKVLRPGLQPRPRNLENSAHADADASPVERVAAARRHQDGIDVQGGRGPENRPYVGVVHDVLQDRNPAGAGEQFGKGNGRGPLHGSHRSAVQVEAGDLLQQ